MANEDKDETDREDEDTGEESSSEPASSASSETPDATRDASADAASDADADEPAAVSATAGDEPEEDVDLGGDTMAVTSMLGPERWVQFGFIALAFAIFFFADKLVGIVWEQVGRLTPSIPADPDPMISAAIAAILGLVTTLYAYRHPQSRKLADEVVAELSQVTWPSRDETYVSTIVVVVTSVVAAAYTGMFDAIWSAITDFVYTI